MAVKTTIPDTDLRWCDLRDTLNAHGGTVTNFFQDAFMDGSTELDSPLPAMHYCTCSTAAAAQVKVMSGYSAAFTDKELIHVKFANTNTFVGDCALQFGSVSYGMTGVTKTGGIQQLDNSHYYSFIYSSTTHTWGLCGIRAVKYKPNANINKWSTWKPIRRSASSGELTASIIKTFHSGLNLDSIFNTSSNPRGCKFTVTSGTSSAVKKLTERILDNFEETTSWKPVWNYLYPIYKDSDDTLHGIARMGDYRNYDPSALAMYDITSVSGFRVSSINSWNTSITNSSQSDNGLKSDDIFSSNHHYGYILANYDRWLEDGVIYIEYIKVNATAINVSGGESISTGVGSGGLNPSTGTYIFIPFIADTDSADAQYWSTFTSGTTPMSGSTLNDTLLEKLGTILALDELVKAIYIINAYQWPEYTLKHGLIYNDQTIYNLASTTYFNVTKHNISASSGGELDFDTNSYIDFSSADDDFNVGTLNWVLSMDIALNVVASSMREGWNSIMSALDVDNEDISLQLYIEKIDGDCFFSKARFECGNYSSGEIAISDYYGDRILIPSESASRGTKPFVRLQIRNYGTSNNHIHLFIGPKEVGSTDYLPDSNNDDDLSDIELSTQDVQFSSDGDFRIGNYNSYTMYGLVVKNMSFYVISNKS